MKYCETCRKQFEGEEEICPICGAALEEIPNEEGNPVNEYEAAEIVSAMMTTGIL